MAAEKVPFVSSAEYLERERKAEFKSEYHAGEIFSMSGASEPHNILNANLGGLLYNGLRGRGCRHYQNDMRVAIRRGVRFVYPDTVVVCGERRFYDGELDTLLNPTLIVEILSPSTESYDRGLKFHHYQQIESLQEYVLISQTPCRVEIFRREQDTDEMISWRYTATEGCDATIALRSIGVNIALADLYEGVVGTPSEEL